MFDWVKEQHSDFPSVTAKTELIVVQTIRAEFNIPKVSPARDFQMVEEPS